MPIRGSVDVVSPQKAEGWAHFPKGRPLVIQALLDNQLIGEAEAAVHRPDLAAAGIGDGTCGFAIQFVRPIDPAYLPFVVFKPEGGDVELPRTGVGGFADYFRSLKGQKPAAGRSRSVYGGLWTDRTDAPALLKSKMRIGQVGPAIAPSLERLIRDGAVELALDDLPAATAARGDPHRAAEALGMDRALRPLLTAVLEDLPAVADAARLDSLAPYQQACAWRDLPSPGECLAVLAPPPNGKLEVALVREGHLLPEFRQDGHSRWTADGAGTIDRSTVDQSVIELLAVAGDHVLVLSPGALFASETEGGEGGGRVLFVPLRARPAASNL